MSNIEKLDSARIKQEKIPYTVHHNYVLQNIKDVTALAIWCYLTSLPDDWKIHRTHLMKHFSIGRDKLFRALKFLHDNFLLEYIQGRQEEGVFGDSHISIKCGYEFEAHHSKLLKTHNAELSTDELSTDSTAILKISTPVKKSRRYGVSNRYTENPLYGKTAPTKEIKNTNKKERERPYVKNCHTALPQKPIATSWLPLSKDFKFNDEHQRLCEQKNLDPSLVEAKFRAHMISVGRKSKDWQEEAKLWILREKAVKRPVEIEKRKEAAPKLNAYASLPDWTEQRLARERGELHGRDARSSSRGNGVLKAEKYLF